jgi:phospholipid/cholesterol/gamma-HCH transport system substrate-binding protein
MSSRASTVKVGFLTLMSISLLIFALVWLRGRGIFSGDSFDVTFKDVDGLRESAPVQMMGIRIGFVDTVEPEYANGQYVVQVKFNISRQGITIPKGSRISIQQSGIIGEKFLEITPPQPISCSVDQEKLAPTAPAQSLLTVGSPVKYLFESGWLTVGQIEHVNDEETSQPTAKKHDEVQYRLNIANVTAPEYAECELRKEDLHEKGDQQGPYYLAVTQNHHALKSIRPNTQSFFTLEEPMRLKTFLDIQLDTAEALKSTNTKISQLLTDDLITSLGKTVENTEVLTARAFELIDAATALIEGTGQDIRSLVNTADSLAENLVHVSDNVQSLIGDEALQVEIRETVAAIRSASKGLDNLLTDPALKEALSYTKTASKDGSELLSLLNRTAHDPQFQLETEQAFTQLQSSLAKLNQVLNTLDDVVHDEDTPLKEVIEQAHSSTKNLEKFSDKLKGRFTLFKLLF